MKVKFGGNAIALIFGKIDGKQKPIGTAFSFLKSNWFVTAKHVVIDDETSLERSELIMMSIAGQKRKVAFPKVIFAHDYHDVAIIDVGSDHCEKPFYPAHHEFVSGNGFIKIGYTPHEHALRIERIKKFKIETRERSIGQETVFQFSDKTAVGGNSGGPLIGEGGGVVGLITQAVPETNTCRATSINVLLNALKLKGQ